MIRLMRSDGRIVFGGRGLQGRGVGENMEMLRGREFFRGLSLCYGGKVSTKGRLIGEEWL